MLANIDTWTPIMRCLRGQTRGVICDFIPTALKRSNPKYFPFVNNVGPNLDSRVVWSNLHKELVHL